MPEIAHLHQFTSTQSGYACEIGTCTARVSTAEIASNLNTAAPGMSNKYASLSDLLNHASKKAGHS